MLPSFGMPHGNPEMPFSTLPHPSMQQAYQNKLSKFEKKRREKKKKNNFFVFNLI